MQNPPNLAPLILSGPSGIGKSYLEKYLCQNYSFERIISTTTRAQRPNEIEGEDYHFISEYEYKQREQEGKFITSVFNLGAWYGFEKSLVEQIQSRNKIPVTICIPQIIDQFFNAYPNSIAFYLLPSNFELLTQRMQQRGDSPEKIQSRIKYAYEEIAVYEKKKNYYQASLTVNENNFTEICDTILTCYN